MTDKPLVSVAIGWIGVVSAFALEFVSTLLSMGAALTTMIYTSMQIVAWLKKHRKK
mgnify:CR=1 FL=1